MNMPSNRLIHEKSPYLLQHARNPVDWHPWTDAAFARAREEDKPVFLSIGYATCHWCHVMERESFEDPDAAEHLNRTFVCIKVDREERPDIDAVYMAACQMLTGSGGWPLTIFMTPDKKPFFAATYLPKHSRFGRAGVIELCQQVGKLWASDRGKVLESADGIAGHLGKAFEFAASEDLGDAVLDRAYTQIEQGYDPVFGGFEGAPKFPTPHRLLFLLRRYHRTADPKALAMVQKTLTAMRLGGIWDHVGFGFHRYSTDQRWLVPHFEKMLYDQAFLALAYLETFQVTKEPFFAETAEKIFTYILRDLTSKDGAFWAAEDADSEGEEGKFYLWGAEEFRRVLGQAEAGLWESVFQVSEDGNFSEEATGRKTGLNILHLDKPLSQWASELDRGEDKLSLDWENARKRLFQARVRRVPPFKDDKVLTDWNGLMIAALATGAQVLDKPEYAAAARRAARFILTNMREDSRRLLHRYRDGEAGIKAHADDYAFFILGLLKLYGVTFDPTYLEQAVALQERMVDDFWDDNHRGFFLSPKGSDPLPVRPKTLYDGAIPSANSVSLFNFLCLSRLTGDPRWEQKAWEQIRAFSGTVKTQPTACTYLLIGLDFALSPGQEVVIAGDPDAPDTQKMLSVLNRDFFPNTVVLVKSTRNSGQLAKVAGFTAGLEPVGEKAAAYVCTNFSCARPVTDVQALAKLVGEKESLP